jgi:hypothetical protein
MTQIRWLLPPRRHALLIGSLGVGLTALSCASGPITHRLGDYGTFQPLFTTPQAQRTPTQMTVNLGAPAYVTVLFVVPGRGTAIVYPVDSVTNTHVDAGAHVVPLYFTETPFNRDSLLASIRRGQQPGRRPTAPPQRLPRDTVVADSARRDSTRRDVGLGGIREPSPGSSPIGYLLLVASSNAIPYPMLKRRVDGITIPIDDDEALSTVMKLVKSTVPDGSTLAGYAQELERM